MIKVGELFSQRRKGKKLSLVKASRDLLIKKEHLEAIEEGRWSNLPEPTVTKGFIKNYAHYLGLESSKILALFRREYDEAKYPHKQPILQEKKRLMITPNRLSKILFIVAILSFTIYLILQYSSILSAPKLQVFSPEADMTTTIAVVQISGRTEKEATVSISGEFVAVDDKGNFSYQMILKEGRNSIEIVASKKLSPKSKITRTVRLVR